MNLTDLLLKWEQRRADPLRSSAMVSLDAVCSEVLADLQSLSASTLETVSLKEASLRGGYSVDHLQRVVAAGQIENVGRKHRPRIRSSDVPHKAGYLPPAPEHDQFSTRRRIVASVATRSEGKAS